MSHITDTTTEFIITRWNFVLLSCVAVVGLGDVWAFPYLVGQYGGGAFLIFYLLFLFMMSMPIMVVVILLGRRGHLSPINSMKTLALEQGAHSSWHYVAWLGTIAGAIILSYYSVFAGETFAYLFRAASGMFTAQTIDGIQSIHNNFRSNSESLLAWHTILIVIVCIIVSRGCRSGVLFFNKLMLPVFLIAMFVLVLTAFYSSGTEASRQYLFTIDWQHFFYPPDHRTLNLIGTTIEPSFSLSGVFKAIESAFYTMALGMLATMAYASFLDQKGCVIRSAVVVVVIDFLVSIIIGWAILSLVFANNMTEAAGTELAFEVMPFIFGSMEHGSLLASLFYVVLFLAAITTMIALAEPLVLWLTERYSFSRVRASVWSGVIIWLMGLLSIFSITGISLDEMLPGLTQWLGTDKLTGSGEHVAVTAFQLLDLIAVKWMLPLTAFFLLIFAGWKMHGDSLRLELDVNDRLVLSAGVWMIRYLAPLLLLVVLLRSANYLNL
jgi:NSS family neurotransmitter:Na+ symporter